MEKHKNTRDFLIGKQMDELKAMYAHLEAHINTIPNHNISIKLDHNYLDLLEPTNIIIQTPVANILIDTTSILIITERPTPYLITDSALIREHISWTDPDVITKIKNAITNNATKR